VSGRRDHVARRSSAIKRSRSDSSAIARASSCAANAASISLCNAVSRRRNSAFACGSSTLWGCTWLLVQCYSPPSGPISAPTGTSTPGRDSKMWRSHMPLACGTTTLRPAKLNQHVAIAAKHIWREHGVCRFRGSRALAEPRNAARHAMHAYRRGASCSTTSSSRAASAASPAPHRLK